MRLAFPNPVPRPQIALTAQGLITQNYPRGPYSETVIQVAQQIRGSLVGLRAGDVVTNLHCWLRTAGVGTGYARMALFAVDGTLLGVSGDANAAFIGAAGYLTIPLSSPYTVLTDAGAYVCQLSDLATTQPTLANGSGIAGSGAAFGSGSPFSVKQASQASFPATATFVVDSSNVWFGVS